MSDDVGWSEEQKRRLIEWVQQKWKDPTLCRQCGEQRVWIAPSPAHLVLGSSDGVTHLGKSYPCAVMTCFNCGYTYLINTMVAGIRFTSDKEADNG